jgi:hypothetical protein
MHNPATSSRTYSFTLNQSMGLHAGSGPFTLSSPINVIGQPGPYPYGHSFNVNIPAQEVFLWKFSGPSVALNHAKGRPPVISMRPDQAAFRFSQPSSFAIFLQDFRGRTIRKRRGFGTSGILELGDVRNGVYILILKQGSREYQRPIAIAR